MKIAFLSAYSGPVRRGSEIYVHELAKRLSQDNVVRVFQLGGKSNENYEIEQIDIEVDFNEKDTSETKERKFGMDYWSRMLARFTLESIPSLIKFNPDIVIPINGHWQYDISQRFCKYTEAKLMITGQWDNDKHALEVNPDIYVALTDRQYQWAKDNGFTGTLRKIHNGVDTKKFSPKGESMNLGFGNAYKTLLCVGELNQQKSIESIVRAVKLVKNLNLVVCGKGERKNELIKLANNLIPGRYKFISLDHSNMPKLYRSVDAFALVPDKSEAFGLVYLEAMASNLPVVAIDDVVRRDMIGNAGLFVNDNSNIDELARAIRAVFNVDFGETPRETALKFSWDNIVDTYNQLIKTG